MLNLRPQTLHVGSKSVTVNPTSGTLNILKIKSSLQHAQPLSGERLIYVHTSSKLLILKTNKTGKRLQNSDASQVLLSSPCPLNLKS